MENPTIKDLISKEFNDERQTLSLRGLLNPFAMWVE